ncbi:hypothetical protein [Stenotrophomonas geniculata]|uniref:Uncharacterized protein n=1 Tax=Stenotrophomonas geniculata TaxID=86188 RepID=A0ABW1MXB8_9GAMM
MSSKYTPGPWKWSGEYTHPCGKPAWTLLGRHGLYGILTCDQGSAPQDLNDEANARLIAAAPELLEALSKAVRETEQFLFDAWLVRVCPSGDVESVQRQWLASGDHRDFVDEWREQIDAIAKATGGAQ